MNNQQLTALDINGEKVLISTFIGKNRSEAILQAQQEVFRHFNLPHNYIYVDFHLGYPYGHAINTYLAQTLDFVDYWIFLDVDAVPLRKDSINQIINFLKNKESVWGISQQSTHIIKDNNSPIYPYAGFSFCAFSKEIYLKCGKPTFSETSLGDIGEQISREIKSRGFTLCLSYPKEFNELTDKEMQDTGNQRHGWVDNGHKLGLGTIFGDNLCLHMFHTDCHKGTNNLRIPRAAELFIMKCKKAINGEYELNYKNKNRKLEMITGCVNNDKIKYSKFLEITLPLNKKSFDNIIIITDPLDLETQRVCRENEVECFCTDKFFENGSKFDNNKAVSWGLKHLKYKDWVISSSPDMIYPDDFREKLNLDSLDSSKMYGTSRLFINTYKDYLDYKNGLRDLKSFDEIIGYGCGFCQIFDLNSPKLKGIPLEETLPSNGIALESDIWFLRRFHSDVRDVGKLDITLIHLGHKDWGGKIRDESGVEIPFFFDE